MQKLKKFTRKNLLLLFIEIAVCLLVGCEQTPKYNTTPKAIPNLDGTNFTDADSRKQGHWIILNETEHLPGYADKDKVREGDYKDGKKQGVWIEYEPGGVMIGKKEYRNDSVVKVIVGDTIKK